MVKCAMKSIYIAWYAMEACQLKAHPPYLHTESNQRLEMVKADHF